MNKDRRAKITKVVDQLDALRWDIECIQDEEQEYFDNMPYSIQQGEKGNAAEEAILALENAVDNIDSIMDEVNKAAE